MHYLKQVPPNNFKQFRKIFYCQGTNINAFFPFEFNDQFLKQIWLFAIEIL